MILTLTMISPLLIQKAKSLQGAQVAVYNGDGAWADGVTAFKNFLNYKGMTWEEVTATDINNNDLRPLYDVLYMPGGDSAEYYYDISSVGRQHILDLVSSGGGYIGLCAGAYYACDRIIWEGVEYDYPLNLYSGYGIGAIDAIMPWDYADMTNLTIVSSHPINQYEPSRERVLYWGGPRFQGGTYSTVATYDESSNAPAAITCTYGSGRVALFGPHPENDENSDRDGTTFASVFYDYGSEWPWLWTTMDWLMGWTISEPPEEPPLPPVGTQLFFDGFESGSLSTNGWTTSGTGTAWYVSTESPYQGTYHAMVKQTGSGMWSYLTSRTISTAGYDQMVSVRYFRQVIGHDSTDEFRVEWYDGTNWNLIEEKNEFDMPAYADIWVFLPSGALNNPNFKIRFADTCNLSSEKVRLDNVEIRAASEEEPPPPPTGKVAIYNGYGVWADSVTTFKNFTKYKGLNWQYVTASDINNGLVTYPNYTVLCMPGGDSSTYNSYISNNGDQNIRNFVSSGGGYLGLCAGAFFACDKITWEGVNYEYTLDLFGGRGTGAIDEIMAWNYAVMTNLTMNLNHPINQYEPSRERMAYYGGPYFTPNAGVTVDTVATYDKKNNERAAITFSYGSGRVFLIGTHAEIEEDKTRDGSSWGEIWYDYGSDWPLLWTTMDWLMGQTVSQPPTEPALPPVGTLLFFDGFESGSLSTNGWTTSGTGTAWYVSTESPYQGTYHAMAKNTGYNKWSNLTSKTISTAGYTQMVSLRYHRRIIGHDATHDVFTVEWYDGTKWNLIEAKYEWNSPNYADAWVFAGQSLVWELPSGALNNPNFKIRFGVKDNAVSEKVYLDNVEIRAA